MVIIKLIIVVVTSNVTNSNSQLPVYLILPLIVVPRAHYRRYKKRSKIVGKKNINPKKKRPPLSSTLLNPFISTMTKLTQIT